MASRAEAPTRRLPVTSFSKANRSEAVQASSQPATSAGSPDFPVLASASTTSARLGEAASAGPAGHISETVSARSPT